MVIERYTRNVRFWIWWKDGLVKLTLKPDQDVQLYTCEKTDEGWSSLSEWYHYNDEQGSIHCSITSTGVDCDGRLDTFWDGYCRIGDEDANELYDDGKFTGCRGPLWERIESYQHDHTAEKSGY